MAFLMESPSDVGRGEAFGHQVIDNKVILDKQYWKHLFERLGWKDKTPPEWGDPYKQKPKDPQRVLLIHHSGYGDMMFVTPVIAAYVKKYPGVKISVETNEKGATILAGNPHISDVLLKKEWVIPYYVDKFDDVINFDGIIARNPESELQNVYDLVSEWSGIELSDDEKKPDLHFYENECEDAGAYLKKKGISPEDKYVVIQYHATSYVRNIPPERWVDLALMIQSDGYKVIMMGNADLGSRAFKKCESCGELTIQEFPVEAQQMTIACGCGKEMILSKEDRGLKGIVFCDNNKTSIRTAALIISQAFAFIGPDSCGIHAAGAFGIPSVGVYFSFDADLRMRYYKNARWIQYVDKGCEPCFQHVKFCHSSPGGYPPCTKNLTSELIYEEFKKLERKEPFVKPAPFVPADPKPCPVCGETQRKYICRKGHICYYECPCQVIYADQEVPTSDNGPSYYETYVTPEYIRGQRGAAKDLHQQCFREGQKNSILDIGCGFGTTIDQLHQLGWEVTGIDASHEVYELNKLNFPWIADSFHIGNFYEYDFKKKFTLIWSNHVLEHLNNPVEALVKMNSLLEPEGIMAIQVPDSDCWRALKLRPHWQGINNVYAGEHVVFHNEKTLTDIALKTGFEVVGKSKNPGPDSIWMYFKKVE